MQLNLNDRAAEDVAHLLNDEVGYGVRAIRRDGGGTIVDCGVESPGGMSAGLKLARICMAGLADVSVTENVLPGCGGPAIRVYTNHPLRACMAAQYAGWKLQTPGFFAMGSGPMRALGSSEPLLDSYGLRERSEAAVGVLETRSLPGDDVFEKIATACGVSRDRVTLLVAPTASLAGTVQIVARSVETAIHKLETLGVDLRILRHGYGVAPLPPAGGKDLVALGRTNDAILYSGDVTLWVETDDEAIQTWGPRVPSESSRDFGKPFLQLFEQYDRDFYKIDPLLFSPAVVRIVNLKTGRTFTYGALRPDLLNLDA